MRRLMVGALALVASLSLVSAAVPAHLEHTGPAFTTGIPETTFMSGGPGASWDLLKTFPTGNPQTDIDFFTQKSPAGTREIYAAVGTLAVGPNGGGQTIFKLTTGGEVIENPAHPGSPQFVSNHPSASCLSDAAAALGLQHDVEATPKGNVIFNAFAPNAVKKDAQLLVDATDNEGRCHDATNFGLDPTTCPGSPGPSGAPCSPQGGLEIIDITNTTRPIEIGLTTHIGEAHTVNVDPKRPHIAYAVTSDSISASCDANDTSCTRGNENPSSSARFNLDGFEVVDLSSCMNFAPWKDDDFRRSMCRPKVYRYRWPTALTALGHEVDSIAGCHELEIYPNDLLTCAGIHATLLFDMSGAFDRNGKPRGTPLPCRIRPSATTPYVPGASGTGAMVTDCVFDSSGQELTIPRWMTPKSQGGLGAPSLQGVRFLGAAYHMGRGGTHDSNNDVDVSHEAELSGSGRLLLVTDERGGGVTPPGADCMNNMNDTFPFTLGNGGIHAYRLDRLLPSSPTGPNAAAAVAAHSSYASRPGPAGGKAIYRANPRTGLELTTCTSHVFHQIPGQNRIFMGWYTQGTQVVDFVERGDGTVEFKDAGHFIPTNANTWVSAVFKMRKNSDETYTYWGATGDFLIAKGRNAVDLWKVTLPPPPRPLGQGGDDGDEGGCPSASDVDSDGLIDSQELVFLTLLGVADSDFDGVVDGNDDANRNGEDDEDEDDHDDCPDRDSDGDGEDDEDEDD